MIDLTNYTKYEPGKKSAVDWALDCERLIRVSKEFPLLVDFAKTREIDIKGAPVIGVRISECGTPSKHSATLLYSVFGPDLLISGQITAIYVPHALEGWEVFKSSMTLERCFHSNKYEVRVSSPTCSPSSFTAIAFQERDGDQKIRFHLSEGGINYGRNCFFYYLKPGDKFREIE